MVNASIAQPYRSLRYEIAQLTRDPEFNAESRKDDEALRTMFKTIAIAEPTREMKGSLKRTVFCYESVHGYQKQLLLCDKLTLIGNMAPCSCLGNVFQALRTNAAIIIDQK